MVYKGEATCKKHGVFEWQIVEGEKNKVIIGINLISINVKTYDKKLKLVIATCPNCGCNIELTDFNFEQNK